MSVAERAAEEPAPLPTRTGRSICIDSVVQAAIGPTARTWQRTPSPEADRTRRLSMRSKSPYIRMPAESHGSAVLEEAWGNSGVT